jgi:hypothetical protein
MNHTETLLDCMDWEGEIRGQMFIDFGERYGFVIPNASFKKTK